MVTREEIQIAAENLVDLGCWRISRDAVANRLGPSIKKLGPVRFPPGTSMIGGQKSGSVGPGDCHIAPAAPTRFA